MQPQQCHPPAHSTAHAPSGMPSGTCMLALLAAQLLTTGALRVPAGAGRGGRMPHVSNEFTGTGKMRIPIIGNVPTTFHFDYAGQRQRFDQKVWGGVQTIAEYHNEGVQYTSFAGNCTKGPISGPLNTYSLAPWAHWVENTTIDGVAVSHWTASAVVGTMDVWSHLSADGKGDELK